METYEKIVESPAAQLIFETELEDTTDKFPARNSVIKSGLTIDPRIDSNLFDDNGKEITVDCPEIACDPTDANDHSDIHTLGSFGSVNRTLVDTPEKFEAFLPQISNAKLTRSTLRSLS
ncbi:uncharacterized protein RAG0_08368 [Rhynchosporium agropyri]|uniref:Uncharacterized protein n=1 Tax=Rhynchosporium agropyri TaxID=914238 RepID=A0A1E1KQJ0_9HELO|nr:uncharacterized protein RAG0_08368 [Rhynchosporium agropyri]